MRLLALVIFLSAVCCFGVSGQADPVDYVNTLVGTQSKYELSSGNTYPAVAMPWGMNFWTPQTGRMGDGWTYTYTADRIRGFKQTHQPSPWINDYGQFSIMPVTGELKTDENGRASWFSHKTETAKPYYYSVYLADHDVTAELTPGDRAAAFRFTFPESAESYVVVDAFDGGSFVGVIPEENKIIGYTTRNSGGVPDNFRNWFVVVFDRPFEWCGVWDGNGVREGATEVSAFHSGAAVRFSTGKGEKVEARVASSFVSAEQAEVNLRELSARTFDEITADGRARWNEVLGRISVEEGGIDQMRTFYSCLYRSLLFPRDLSEVTAEGRRVHYSPYNGEVLPGEMFTDTGFWDTFRSLFPLLNLLYPEMAGRMQAGLVNTYLESGFLPEWASPGHRGCMVGNNSASVVADAWIKGIRGYDVETLWEAVLHGANAVHPQVSSTGRLGWEQYNELGYVPCDAGIAESAARTLEYAYDDWCIWRLGKALGRPDTETAPYARRALNYRNLFDPKTRLMRGRRGNGAFRAPFNPFQWGGDFTEGNSWHYTWSVFHDPAGLVALMGGREGFNAMMDSVFTLPPIFDESYYGQVIHEIREMQIAGMGNYAHGNQPIQHMIYLYDWSGEPWKAQWRVREVMEKLYSAAPDGYCGDEDNGQTSAWYVFSALGLYPVCPGTDQYAVGSPLFGRVVLRMPGGRTTVISAPDNSPERRYIGSMTVDGTPCTKNYLTHETLLRGAKIEFAMSSEPNKTRGTAPSDAPYSFSTPKNTSP